MVFTASNVLLQVLVDAGITHAFVNLGSDHPSLLEAFIQRNRDGLKSLQIVTCPNESCLSTVNLPFDHVSHSGVSFGQHNPLVEEADFILIIDSDVPWMPMHTKPSSSCEIYHIDCDPLKTQMAFHAFPSLLRAKADAALALAQMYAHIIASPALIPLPLVKERLAHLTSAYADRQSSLAALETLPSDNIMTGPFIVASLRRNSPAKTTVCNEAISNYPHVWNHMRPSGPGSLFSSGASSLGWALGAAIGMQFAAEAEERLKRDLIAVVVGDGSFIFGVPSAAYWMARRYETPFLTIVLNNGVRPVFILSLTNESLIRLVFQGWKSPRLSLLGVHPNGIASQATAQELNVSFGPDAPDYGGIAAAAGGAWSRKVSKASELEEAMIEAIRVVVEEKRCAVLDCWLERFA
ncbi:hypothetical protein P7C70_g1834, partial [Phenoliferia sp. Uapishka_3]